jgi:predicted nucleic acid-binding protein
LEGRILALSFQSVAELLGWAEENRWGAEQRAGLDAFLGRFLIIPYEVGLARVWARVITHSKAIGRRLETGDAWIAATALHRGISLLSHDRDFLGLELAGLDVVCYASQV